MAESRSSLGNLARHRWRLLQNALVLCSGCLDELQQLVPLQGGQVGERRLK